MFVYTHVELSCSGEGGGVPAIVNLDLNFDKKEYVVVQNTIESCDGNEERKKSLHAADILC